MNISEAINTLQAFLGDARYTHMRAVADKNRATLNEREWELIWHALELLAERQPMRTGLVAEITSLMSKLDGSNE